ncbi:hypothetical protein HPP92_019736 [Vanilla planifolia]|uniref:Nuclease associated modular domain-containing protein n=1 Tax=Vanilla planifolia TaxID=51239 RepID=A0A835QA75_VANPL|nr:hypothetical protein HPP92_019736 [Vanilla planifolia]
MEESSRGEPTCSKVSIVKCGGHILHDLEEDLMNKCTNDSELSRNTVAVCNRELERRRKIGVANRGRTPWNKGRTHSKETIELIKKRTIEALKDPKVRKKMSERSHSHSEQSKSSISLALKRFWLERLKHKQSMEKVYLSWVGHIAVAAKKGGDDQIDLDWDSFQEIKADLNCKYLQEREEKAKTRQAKKPSKCLQDKMEKAKARETKFPRTEKAAMSWVENIAQKMQKKQGQAIAKAFAQENMLNK